MARAARRGGATVAAPVRVSVWVLHIAVPLLGLWLLVARPAADVMWEDHPVHFWLVLGTALLNVGVAAAMNVEARRRQDARLFLVSLGFAASAGFLGLHALATPGMLMMANTGFSVATPVGLLIASVFAAWSASAFSDAGNARILRAAPALRALVAAAVLAWLVASLARAKPLAMAPMTMEVHGSLVWLMSSGSVLFLYAALRYWLLFRRRPSVVLLSVITAFVLLAEALVSVTYGRNWHASWWEWHLLMTFAFGFVAYSAVVQWGREGSARSLFAGVALQQSVQALQSEYGAALEALVAAAERGEQVDVAAHRVAERFGLSERQRDVLVRSGEALAHERELIRENAVLYRRLDGLFRSYLSPDVAASLLADPTQADLGGAVTDVSVLMADLAGFTAFAEHTAPTDVVAMLNSYYGVVVPIILDDGGTVVQFVGDAIMAIFNAPVRQADHAVRAARAALRLQHDTAGLGTDAWPRFRVGVNSGPALVGNVGAEAIRVFTAIGDTTNLAARLEAHAPVGGVLISAATLAGLPSTTVVEPVGELDVKGKDAPVRAYLLRSLPAALASVPGPAAQRRQVADQDGPALGLDPAPGAQ